MKKDSQANYILYNAEPMLISYVNFGNLIVDSLAFLNKFRAHTYFLELNYSLDV